MTLLPTDVASAQLPISLDRTTEGTLVVADASPMGIAGDDSVLQDLSQTTGDEWLLPLLSGASSGPIAIGMLNPSEDVMPDPEYTEEDIVITGRRPTQDPDDWNGVTGGVTGGTGGTGSTGGGTPGGGIGTAVAQHNQDCGTEDGAAVQVANHVKGSLPPETSGPVDPLKTSSGNDWTKVEFGAVIVRNPDGSFGALNNKIYSSDQSGFIVYPNIAGQPVQGLWHSHDQFNDTARQNLLNRYPSTYDWNQLSVVAAQPNSASDPSLWIMDAFGVTREFKLSERNYFENMDETKKEAAEGLAGKERTQSCG